MGAHSRHNCIIEEFKRARTKPLNYANLADIEQRQKEVPGRFLERLPEGLQKFTNNFPESAEGETIIKDKFLTHSASDSRHKLQKEAFGPNQPSEKFLQLTQTVYYSREYKKGKQQKRTKEKAQALEMAGKTAMSQPEEKNAQRSPGEKGQAC